MQEQDAQVRPEHGAVDRPAAQDALRTDLPAGRSTLSRASGRSPGARAERWKKSNEDLRVEARKGDEEGRGITGDATPPQGGGGVDSRLERTQRDGSKAQWSGLWGG